MPPQLTNFTLNAGRAAAGRRLNLVITSAKDATGNALAEPRLDASIAALQDAFSEKQAAGPPDASTRGVLSLFRRYWRAFRARRQRARLRVTLHNLSERELMDIGLTQGDIDCIVANRAFERLRDGTTHPWLSRGVM